MRSNIEVDVPTFAAALADGAYVIDVRETFEYASGHVPGARSVPLGALAVAVDDLPRHEPVYVICASGNRSLQAAVALQRSGFDARSVAGGTSAWQGSNRPTVIGAHAA